MSHYKFILSLVVVVNMFLIYPAGFQSRGGYDHIHAGLIQGNRIKRSSYTDIRNQRVVVESPAIAVRRYVHDKRDMKAGPVLSYGQCIFGNFAIGELRS